MRNRGRTLFAGLAALAAAGPLWLIIEGKIPENTTRQDK